MCVALNNELIIETFNFIDLVDRLQLNYNTFSNESCSTCLVFPSRSGTPIDKLCCPDLQWLGTGLSNLELVFHVLISS